MWSRKVWSKITGSQRLSIYVQFWCGTESLVSVTIPLSLWNTNHKQKGIHDIHRNISINDKQSNHPTGNTWNPWVWQTSTFTILSLLSITPRCRTADVPENRSENGFFLCRHLRHPAFSWPVFLTQMNETYITNRCKFPQVSAWRYKNH